MLTLELLDALVDFRGIRSRIGGRIVVVIVFLARPRARNGDFGVRIDEADDDVLQARIAALYFVVDIEEQVHGRGKLGKRCTHLIQALLDSLGDANLALARQQLDGAHFAHIHAHGVGRAAELAVDRRQRRRCLVCRILVTGNGGIRQ